MIRSLRAASSTPRARTGLLAALATALLVAACGQGAALEPTAAPLPAPEEAIGEPASAFTPTPEPGLGGKRLVVGTDATYPPFESTDADGNIVGIDPDLMEAICELAGCNPEFQHTEWDGIFAALAAREFDVLMSAMTILPEREESSGATFTEPYFSVGQVVLVGSDSELADPTNLGESSVAVQQGTTGDTAATDTLLIPAERMLRFQHIVEAVQAVLSGDADAAVMDNPTAEIFVARYPGQLRVLGEPFTEEDYGILVPNESPEVLEALNMAIRQLKADGRVKEIVSRWYEVDE